MAINVTEALRLLPFTNREAYSSPYPVGLAIAAAVDTGDATGGTASFTLEAPGEHLFRIEQLKMGRSDAVTTSGLATLSEQFLADRTSFGSSLFDHDWIMDAIAEDLFTTTQYRLDPADLKQMRRIPIGTARHVAAFNIAIMRMSNIDTIAYTFEIVLSYWEITALKEPGFLQSFWEAPIVERELPAIARSAAR